MIQIYQMYDLKVIRNLKSLTNSRMHADEGIESKYSLGRIADARYKREIVTAANETFEHLIKVENEDGNKFVLPIFKFLPFSCLPEFRFVEKNLYSYEDDKLTNSLLWSRTAFWMCDGKRCSDDIFNMANMEIKTAQRVYSAETVEKELSTTDVDTPRLDRIEGKYKSLGELWKWGILWWAPPPFPENYSKL